MATEKRVRELSLRSRSPLRTTLKVGETVERDGFATLDIKLGGSGFRCMFDAAQLRQLAAALTARADILDGPS